MTHATDEPNSYLITTHFFATTHRMLFAFFWLPNEKMPKKPETCERPGAALAPWRIWWFFFTSNFVAKRFTKKQRLGNHVQKTGRFWTWELVSIHFSGCSRLVFLRYPFGATEPDKKHTHTRWMMNTYSFISRMFVSMYIDEKYANNAWIILCVGGQNQLMANWWFRLVFWIPGIPLWNNLGVPRESQTTNPNQQLTTSWQDVVKWKKNTTQISRVSAMTKGQWMSLDVTWMIQSTYQVVLATSVLCGKQCVKSPASHGFLSILSISASQQKSDHFKLLTFSHSLGEIAQIPVNI